MRYVVGYAATARGGDALNLAVALARQRGAALELVMVMPANSPYNGVYPPESGFGDILAQQVSQWLDEALALVPPDVQAQAHIRCGESEAQALLEAAAELGAELLVIGASSTGLFKRFSIGSVASSLLHAAPIPVALAPAGYSRTDPITRLTCALGTRAGAADVMDTAITMAKTHQVPLRLLSLVALSPEDSTASIEQARAHLHEVAEAKLGLGAQEVDQFDIVVGQGRSIEDAVDALDWDKGEILLIGSSRLAQNKAIFLGATANRILRALPVPMIVVPLNYQQQSGEPFPLSSGPENPEAAK